MATTCPECGAHLSDCRACEEAFHQLLAWEHEYPPRGAVHHLLVLCYYLQHPSRYSPEGLTYGRGLLKEFVVGGQTPQAMRRRSRDRVNSRDRAWKVSARSGAQGHYDQEMAWTMHAAEVLAGGPDHTIENVQRWAGGIWDVLKEL